MVARQNLTVYQGADYRRALEFKDNSAVLMNLTGYTFRGQVKASYQDESAVFSFGFTLRDQTTDTGVVDMILTAADTSAVEISKATNYIYDIEMVDTDGYVTRVVEGSLKLYPEVTKA
jgi:hypothetical protein